MAFGTPVAGTVFYRAGSINVQPTYPAGIQSTDVVLMFIGQKPSTGTTGEINIGEVIPEAGWTRRGEFYQGGGYTAVPGIDTGNTNLRVFSWDTPAAGQTGPTSFHTQQSSNVLWAFIVRIPSGDNTLLYGSASGQNTVVPDFLSIELTDDTTATNFQAGDLAIWSMCIPTDVTTPNQFYNHAITATGAVFNTAIELREPDTSLGSDIGGFSAYSIVTSGSSTTAPTIFSEVSGVNTNVRGPIVLLRVREGPALITLTSEPVLPVSESWSGSGLVNNKKPTTGGGRWQITSSKTAAAYGAGQATSNVGSGSALFRHSFTLTDATISTTVYPGSRAGYNVPVYVYARSTPGPTADITDGYYLIIAYNEIRLYKKVAGVDSAIVGTNVDTTGLSLSFSVIGSVITVLLNNVQVIQVTDTSITTSGYWGYEVDTALDEIEGAISSSVGPITLETPSVSVNGNLSQSANSSTANITQSHLLVTTIVPAVTLVQENWNVGQGYVNGKAPDIGTGIWQNPPETMFYDSGFVYSGQDAEPSGFPVCLYSIEYTDVKFQALISTGSVDGIDLPNFIYARVLTGNNDYYKVEFYPGYSRLAKVVGGVETQLGYVGGNLNGQTVALQAVGSTIKVFASGSEIISVSDSSISGPGKWGFSPSAQSSGETTIYVLFGPITIQTIPTVVSNPIQNSNSSTGLIVHRHNIVASTSTSAANSSLASISQRHQLTAATSTQSSVSSTTNTLQTHILAISSVSPAVTLVQEDWVGYGNVQNRTPSPISGGGVWAVDTQLSLVYAAYNSARAVQTSPGIFRHSVSLTNLSITAVITPAYAGDLNCSVIIWARSTPGPYGSPSNGYRVVCSETNSGISPLISLQKIISGAETQIGSSGTDPTNQSVSFILSGSLLTVKVNGITVIEVTDTSISTAGYWGYVVELNGDEEVDVVSFVGPVLAQTIPTSVVSNPIQNSTSSSGLITQIHTTLVGSANSQSSNSATAIVPQTYNTLAGSAASQSNATTSSNVYQNHILIGASVLQASNAGIGLVLLTIALTGATSVTNNTASIATITQTYNIYSTANIQNSESSVSAILIVNILIGSFTSQFNTTTSNLVGQNQLTREQIEQIVNYLIGGLMPTVSQIADEIISRLTNQPISVDLITAAKTSVSETVRANLMNANIGVNIKLVNDVSIKGTGQSGNEWGPM